MHKERSLYKIKAEQDGITYWVCTFNKETYFLSQIESNVAVLANGEAARMLCDFLKDGGMSASFTLIEA